MKSQEPDSSTKSAKMLGITLLILFALLLIVVFSATFSQK
jgi:hypothetical protein